MIIIVITTITTTTTTMTTTTTRPTAFSDGMLLRQCFRANSIK